MIVMYCRTNSLSSVHLLAAAWKDQPLRVLNLTVYVYELERFETLPYKFTGLHRFSLKPTPTRVDSDSSVAYK